MNKVCGTKGGIMGKVVEIIKKSMFLLFWFLGGRKKIKKGIYICRWDWLEQFNPMGDVLQN